MTTRQRQILGSIFDAILFALFVIFVGLAWVAQTGCSTVVPKPVASSEASFDGNQQNSGFLSFEVNGAARITANARDRYNALIRTYGRDAQLVADQGLSPNSDGSWSITKECLVKFLEMNDWKRAGFAPVKP